MPIYSIQSTVTAGTQDGALAALVALIQQRPPAPGPPDTSGHVQAYQITEWVTGTFTAGPMVAIPITPTEEVP